MARVPWAEEGTGWPHGMREGRNQRPTGEWGREVTASRRGHARRGITRAHTCRPSDQDGQSLEFVHALAPAEHTTLVPITPPVGASLG
jgi:hypothetical protein